LKDLTKLEETGAVINEVVTSQHDTGRVSEMFLTLKSNYRRYKNSSLFFRYLVSDLCWPTIHGMLEIMNMETIHDYSKRIYKYASDKEVNAVNQKGFLASCISHSTHRFTKGLKRYVKFSEKEHKIFVGCCFSLLANSTELVSTANIFKLMCDVFLRPIEDATTSNARETLQKMIELRPNDRTEIIKLINEVYPDALDDTESESESEENTGNIY
jgi:hypothetical protein